MFQPEINTGEMSDEGKIRYRGDLAVSSHPAQEVADVLIYDPTTLDWTEGNYPYVPAPVAIVELSPSSKPTEVDVEVVQVSTNPLTYENRAFIINSGNIPNSNPPEDYNGFAVVKIDGGASVLLRENRSFTLPVETQSAEAVDVGVGANGANVYFTCPGIDRVRYFDTIDPFTLHTIRNDENTGDADIINPIAIALGEMSGSGKEYLIALDRLVGQFPLSAFVQPEETSKTNLLNSIQENINCYEQHPSELIECLPVILSLRTEVSENLATEYYRDIVLERQMRVIHEIMVQNIVVSQPETYLVFIQSILQGSPLSAFDNYSSRQSALALVQEALSQLNSRHYGSAIENLSELETIIDDHVTDAGLLSMIRDIVDEAQASITVIVTKFTQSASECGAMETYVNSLPNSPVKNNGARQSLLNHIDQAKSDCEGYRLDQALQKANLVRTDIPGKIEDEDAQLTLLAEIDHIIAVLQSIDQ